MKSPKHIICILLCVGILPPVKAQNYTLETNSVLQEKQSECIGTNLLGNASFEDTIKCPNTMTELGDIGNTIGWSNATFVSTADYFHTCGNITGDGVNNGAGTQNPRTGNAYAGIYTFFWDGVNFISGGEYLQHKLLDSLETGGNYCVSFYVSLADNSIYNCNNIGVYFSNDSVYSTTDTLLPFTPQVTNDLSNSLADKNNWTLVSGNFEANGGEKYLVLGNFTQLIDVDTSNISGLYPYAYYYIDDISVVLDTTLGISELPVSNYKCKLYPNPSNGKMTLDYNLETDETGVIVIYNATGKEMVRYRLSESNKQLQIDNQELSDGIYFYKIVVNSAVVKQDKLIITK